MKNRIPYVSVLLLIINVMAYFYLEFTGSTYDYEFLSKNGALSTEAFFNNKDYMCLVTHMFMHSGVTHLAYNMFTLIVTGCYIENKIGRFNYAVIYMISGLFAGAASLVWYVVVTGESVVSVGASGAIYGILGAMIAYIFADKELFEEIGVIRICLFLFLSIYGTSLEENVGYVSHIAGFVFGFVIAGVIILIKKLFKKEDMWN